MSRYERPAGARVRPYSYRWRMRLLFAVLFIFAGAGLLVYLLLWMFVPSE